MPITSANWAELLTPQTSEAFVMGFTSDGRRASMISEIFAMPDSDRAFEEHVGVGQFSSSWDFEATGRVPYDDKNKGFLKRWTHKEFAKGFIVQRKMIDDNLFPQVLGDARDLGDSAFRNREKSAATVFANAFSAVTTQTTLDAFGFPVAGPDDVALCSTAHPRSADDATTWSNEGTLAFTKDNVGATRQLHMALTDDRGDLLNVMPDLVLIPPELEDTAIEIGRSQLDPNSANNAVNPQAGRFRYLVWHYLEDGNAWFMIDSARMRRDLIWYERIPLEFGPQAGQEDFDTYQVKYRAYMRYSRGWRAPYFVYGQNPA
jgi:Mu-like prophage major head subunit gpT